MNFYWLLFVAIVVAATGKFTKRIAPMSMSLFSLLQHLCYDIRISLLIRYFYELDSAYVDYEKDGKTKWECKDNVAKNSFFNTKEEAEEACNTNPECKYIENEDCSGTEGYELCTSIEEDSKSCVLVKEGHYLK